MTLEFCPHNYQRYCIDRIVSSSALALWLDMGLGKSVISLTAIADLKFNRFQIEKVLVIAPKKVAEATWQNEGRKWSHLQMLRFSTVLGSTKKRIIALNTPADIYVINRDNTQWLVDYYRNDWPFDTVVLDEATSFKNRAAKRFKALKSVRPHIKRIVELTGTPAPRSLMDLWAQVYLLDSGQRLGKTLGAFRERYFVPDKRNQMQVFTYKPKDGAEQAVEDLLSDICVSMKAADYLDLPEMITDDIPVMLDPAAEKAYKQLERDALLQVDESTIDAQTAAVLTNKLLQLCNGAVYDETGKATEIHKCKLEALLELVEALDGQHALVFYNFQHDRDRIVSALSKTKLRVKVFSGPQDENDWNAGKIDVLLAHPASCAYGLNLQQGGHHVIWFGLNWSLELVEQANKRLHRQGQKEPVIIHRLVVQNSMDEDVVKSLESKSETQESLLQSLKARIKDAKENTK